MASTSEELLDLFEEKYAVQDELLPETSSNHEGKTPESASLAASVDLAPEGDKLEAPFARRFYIGRKADRLFVLSELHSQRGILASARLSSSAREGKSSGIIGRKTMNITLCSPSSRRCQCNSYSRALRWHVSRKARDEKAGLVNNRPQPIKF